jgi:ATP-dependent helicase/nuclease subunit A
LVVACGGFYECSEITDLLSLLQLLDNPLQDVPCIAVLRSPLVGLSLDELAAIRLTATREYFWTALVSSQRSEAGIQPETATKVSQFLGRFSRWRRLAKQISISQCLEEILAETFYADWLRSQPRGEQRAANVAGFLQLAQQFDQFQRQGLFRFLKFIEAQQSAEAEPEVPAVAAENAVRLMSIHQSKGLEFPVVALADLAKRFNEQDLRGEIIFDEEYGLCPKVKPPQTGQRYPSLPHWLAQRRQKRELRGEELRLLYVALTRARDMLILTGSVTEKKWETLWTTPGEISAPKILAAQSYADWLGLWFAQQPGASPELQGSLPQLRWWIAADEELSNILAAPPGEAASAEGSPGSRGNSSNQSEAADAVALERLRGVLSWRYGFGAATQRAAKSSVTALRRQAEELDEEAEQFFPARQNFTAKSSRLSAADTGTAHHKFLQHVALENADEPAALAAEAARLEREKILTADERAALDLPAVAAFWKSAAGRKIRRQAAAVRRELAFTARFSPAELAEIIGTNSTPDLSDEFIVVQGVADLVVLLPREIWLVDFKTDAVRADDLPAKIKIYAPQLKLYARALAKIYARPVTHCWLHFLPARRTEEIGA